MIVQAPFSGPIRWSAGTRTPSKNTSLSWSPSSVGSGFTVTPGLCFSMINSDRPRARLSWLPVRTSVQR